jgi:hypothetical protein
MTVLFLKHFLKGKQLQSMECILISEKGKRNLSIIINLTISEMFKHSTLTAI